MDEIEDIENILLNKPLSKVNIDYDIHIENIEKYIPFINELININDENKENYIKKYLEISRKYRIMYKYSYVLYIYKRLLNSKLIEKNIIFEKNLRINGTKSSSGVIVLTVVLSPYPEYEDEDGNIIKQKFTCEWNCYYCPNEPGQPRSYLKLEPAVQRANSNNFEPIKQVWNRLGQLENTGHKIDKVEIIVLGGTWESYPVTYRENFIRDVFYGINVYFEDENNRRDKLSLIDEQLINENADIKIVALKLETRPDTITGYSLQHLRYLGCTHIQIGVQHIFDSVLKKINRGVYYSDIVRAIRYLKDNCFKIDIHLMPDLPGSNVDIDMTMFEDFLGIVRMNNVDINVYHYELSNGDIQADEWKVYPCQTVPWTVIHKWYKSGKYVSYGDDNLKTIIKYINTNIYPWIRLNRIIRDIPVEYVLEGTRCTNMRQVIDEELKKDGIKSMDIRSREVKNKKNIYNNYELVERWYNASDGVEVFISFENKDYTTLYGLLRLRLSSKSGYIDDEIVFKELVDCALIRQIHVYGELQTIKNNEYNDGHQHKGLGKKLIERAEEISKKFSYKKIAVIASIGTRNYYRKYGYDIEEYYMTKKLE